MGTAGPSETNYGGLLLKLDSVGAVQWERVLGPDGSTNGMLNAVQQTADGGYVATGELYSPSGGLPKTSVLVVKVDPDRNVDWQQGYNNFDTSGSPTGAQHANAIIQTTDGCYLVVGGWANTVTPAGSNALLLKLDSSGNVEGQKAYDGGVHCYFNGFNTTCGPHLAAPLLCSAAGHGKTARGVRCRGHRDG